MLRPLVPLLALGACLAQVTSPQEPAPSANVRYGDIPGQDAREYSISLRVDLAHGRLVGDVFYTFTALEELSTITLDARRSDDWKVTFAAAGGKALPAEWREDQVVLTLPQPAAKGTDLHFTAHLEGVPVDGFYFRDDRYGERLAFTDHYSIRARGWLPCEDNPADRARFSLLLQYPKGNEAVAFGSPMPPPPDSGPVPADYDYFASRSNAEIPPYMFAIVVGPFARIAEDGDPRLVPHYVYRRDAERSRPMLAHHAEWLQRMERTFGPYPFAKYTTVQCPTRWGGFEAPGNVQLAEDLFDHGARGVGTLAHELVHMWFGDGVGYAEWREVWLAEGFASYFGPWLHADAGGPPLRESMRQMRASWLSSFEGRTKTVRDDRFPHPDQALNSNTYPKGAWVLHMLRGELGDEAFFAALRAYFESCRGRSVRTADFVAAVEKSCGRELGGFFAQWLDRVGCPELAIGERDGKLVVEQRQAGEPYEFWLRVAVGSGEQRREHRERVTQKVQALTLAGPFEDLQVDPEVELLFRPAR